MAKKKKTADKVYFLSMQVVMLQSMLWLIKNILFKISRLIITQNDYILPLTVQSYTGTLFYW